MMLVAPSFVPSVYCAKLAILRRKVSPRCAGSDNPKAGIHENAVIVSVRPAPGSQSLVDDWLDFVPLLIGQIMSIL